MKNTFDQICIMLFELWKYDVEVFSKPWIYYCVFPAIIYLLFFFIKWMVITAPLWLPIRLALSSFKIYKEN